MSKQSNTYEGKVIVRVTNEMKADLEKLAQASRRELSDYMRLIFEDTIKKKVKV